MKEYKLFAPLWNLFDINELTDSVLAEPDLFIVIDSRWTYDDYPSLNFQQFACTYLDEDILSYFAAGMPDYNDICKLLRLPINNALQHLQEYGIYDDIYFSLVKEANIKIAEALMSLWETYQKLFSKSTRRKMK